MDGECEAVLLTLGDPGSLALSQPQETPGVLHLGAQRRGQQEVKQGGVVGGTAVVQCNPGLRRGKPGDSTAKRTQHSQVHHCTTRYNTAQSTLHSQVRHYTARYSTSHCTTRYSTKSHVHTLHISAQPGPVYLTWHARWAPWHRGRPRRSVLDGPSPWRPRWSRGACPPPAPLHEPWRPGVT